MPSNVIHIQDVPSISVAVVRRVARPAELPRFVPEFCGLVWSALKAQGIRGGRNIAIYWDDAIHLEAGVELPGSFTEHEPVIRSATPAGLTVTTTHLGPYHTLGVAHDAIWAWAAEHGHRLAGPRWEIYGHWREEWNDDPSSIRTDIFYQIDRSRVGH